MKLTLKPEWRLRPLNSFLGFIDLKLGVTIALLFALLNKVAGVYGLIAVFTGGSFAQLSMYVYSVGALVAFTWALNAVAAEDAQHTLYFAHLFAFDHVLNTAWTVFFAVVWWMYTPHDGRRTANSAAQEDLIQSGVKYAGPSHNTNMTDVERAQAAMSIWNKEKGTAVGIIVGVWIVKVSHHSTFNVLALTPRIKLYFIALMYSYAIHLRKGSYRTLPCSKPIQTQGQYVVLNGATYPEEFDDDTDTLADDFYHIPPQGSPAASNVLHDTFGIRAPKTPGTGSSITSFADFVSAPGRGRRARGNGLFAPRETQTMVEDVMFDADAADRVEEDGGARSPRTVN